MRKTLVLLFTLAPSICFANGGLPIIWLLNTYAFLVGIIFVLIVEYKYLKKLVKATEHKALKECVIKFNFFSTLFGVIALPLFMFIAQLEPLSYMIKGRVSEKEMNLIWWASLSLDLLIAYFGTVFIEYLVLKKCNFWVAEISSKQILKHVFSFNLYSYAILLALVLVTYALFKFS